MRKSLNFLLISEIDKPNLNPIYNMIYSHENIMNNSPFVIVAYKIINFLWSLYGLRM